MATNMLIPFLVAMMLLTGVCNTLLTKYQDNQCVRNCDDPDPKTHAYFEQPVLQTLQMFIGEMGCWLVIGAMALYERYTGQRAVVPGGDDGYQPVATDSERVVDSDAVSVHSTTALNGYKPSRSSELRGPKVLLLALPSICDILGTTLMNAGLLMVAASIYQMTRGALVLFVGLFSVVFLHRHLHLYQWLSLVGVVVGVAIVGLAGTLSAKNVDSDATVTAMVAEAMASTEAVRVVVGVLLIAGAQIFTATQFVLEEFILERWSVAPIHVVGYEGIFGFLVTLIGMFTMHLLVGRTDAGRFGYFDMVEGWRQMVTNGRILGSSVLIMISIGGFNFFGLSVTRTVSATSRSTIDTCRTLFIWLVSLSLGWETFKALQVVGFVLLVYFTFTFNGLVTMPGRFLKPQPDELLPEEPVEHI